MPTYEDGKWLAGGFLQSIFVKKMSQNELANTIFTIR
jgi:hypothetical protein